MAPFPSPTPTWHSDTYDSLSPKRPELSAAGKNVFITGGGSGIGAETAKYFAAAGASRIAVVGRREQPLLDTKASIEQEYPNVKVFVASTDVTSKTQVDKGFFDFAGSEKIHVLVSSAAAMGPMDSVEEADSDKFADGIAQNLKGAVLVAQAFLRHAATDATVIDINSSAAHVTFGGAFASYTIAKLAVFRLWDLLGSTHPEMSVFHIQPGVVDTAMNKEAGGVEAFGFADDVSLPASFNVWLASPEARFLKGKFLWANWDVDELKSQADEIKATGKYDIGLIGWPFGHTDWQLQMKGGE